MKLLNTLYVTLPDSHLRLDNDTLRLLVGDETRLRVPLHHLSAVVCMGPVSVSVPLMHRLAEDGIALVLLDASGCASRPGWRAPRRATCCCGRRSSAVMTMPPLC